MSNDLTHWTSAMAATLRNPEMIAIDQDPLGISGRVVLSATEEPHLTAINPNLHVIYARPLHNGAVAVGLMNRGAAPAAIVLDLALVGVDAGVRVDVRDVWARADLGTAAGAITREVCSHCTDVLRLRLASGGRIDFQPWRKPGVDHVWV